MDNDGGLGLTVHEGVRKVIVILGMTVSDGRRGTSSLQMSTVWLHAFDADEDDAVGGCDEYGDSDVDIDGGGGGGGGCSGVEGM
jgi:hypothetical protein